jgi:uncharacterized membrane protein YcaP (DUF421 family)
MWFDSWAPVLRVLIVGTVSYVTLVGVLRLSGKRTLSQLNAFDFIVTVALGSTLATILLSSDVPYAEGVAALGLLAGLQFLVAWVSSRWPRARSAITSQPTALLVDGHLRTAAVRRNRLTEAEVLQAVRSTGSGDISSIAAVVLETDGTLSVISRDTLGDGSALGGLTDEPESRR